MLLSNNNHAENTDIFPLLSEYNYGEVHVKNDAATGLRAIVAIHNTKFGPALGGCRCISYPNTTAALRDALRLAQAMSYKAALADLPLGGGKSVILRPAHISNREAFFEAFGLFIKDLGGRYITAMDSGTTEEDMNIIARKTTYIAGHSLPGGISGNPAPFTALGVRLGIQAAVKFKLQRESLKGMTIVVQGVGQVGYCLAKELHALGAKLIVADINEIAAQRCVEEFNAEYVDYNTSFGVECDVLAPCALGGSISDETIEKIKAPIVAGAANNVLLRPEHGDQLHRKNILYAPDFMINAGGLIHACSLYFKKSEDDAREKIQHIYARLGEVFARAERENQSTSIIAETLAQELLQQK